jgi:hypothetical protein
VPSAFEPLAELGEVVNFSIENDPDALVFVVDWLVSAAEVNDAQSAHSQADWPACVNSLVVGTAMDNRLAHAVNVGSVYIFAFTSDNAGYAAHDEAPLHEEYLLPLQFRFIEPTPLADWSRI